MGELELFKIFLLDNKSIRIGVNEELLTLLTKEEIASYLQGQQINIVKIIEPLLELMESKV